ncbi:MAG: cell division protein ZapA [Alphaproteobacteria bacterium]
MGQLSININGRTYQIACDEGKEAHLTQLGAYVDKRVQELVASVGQIGDTRLLVMASLLIADELTDVYDELEALRARPPGREGAAPAAAAPAGDEDSVARSMEAVAQRIEDIASRLEGP